MDEVLRWISNPQRTIQLQTGRSARRQNTVLYPDGQAVHHTGPLSLADAQTLVRGYVEVVFVPGDETAVLLCNADALVVQEVFPVNHWASCIAGQPIVGVAVLTHDPEWTGDDAEEENL